MRRSSILPCLRRLLLVAALTMGSVAITSPASGAETAAQRYEQYRYALETINLTHKRFVARQNDFRSRASGCGEEWSPIPSPKCKKPVPYNHFDWTDDGCSGRNEIGPLSLAYRNLFNEPCRLHDFGYRNFGKGLALYKHEDMRARIDTRFLEEMSRLCSDKYGQWWNFQKRSECGRIALAVYTAVRNIPSNSFGLSGQPPPNPGQVPAPLPPLPPLPQQPLPPVAPLPSGPAKVTLAQGPAAPAGYRYAITLSGFTPGSAVSITCYDSVSPGGFYSFHLTADVAGGASTASYCYSGDGPDHWVIANGVQSNHATWGGGSPPPAPTTYAETTGSTSGTFTNYTNAGGSVGPTIGAQQTVQVACKLTGFAVANGNTWWYRIASAPWNNAYYAPADNFYNNGATSGSLAGTPWVDPAVPNC
jgi:Prokaryotic phospholipase A2